MIELIMTGMCEGCTQADLELDYYNSYIDERYWNVRCKHKSACDRMEDMTIERLREENEQKENSV